MPKLRFKIFEDGWKDTVLGDLFSFNNGVNADKGSYGHGRKFINVLDILNNRFIKYDDIIGSVSVSPNVEESNKVEYGDLIFLRSSETRDDVGKSSVYLDKNEFALFGGFVIRGKKQADYHPYFLKLNLESQNVRNQIGTKAGGSTRFNVSQSILSSVEIKIPSQDEQSKIAEFFLTLDLKIKKQQEKITLLKEQKKGYMQKIFKQEIRFKDEHGRDYPAWETKSINDIFNVITDYVANGSFESIRNNVSYSEKEDFAYVIRLQDASNNWKGPFVYTNEHAYTFLKKTELFVGDIIMSNVGSVGKFFKIPELDKPMTLGPNALLLRSNKNNNEFLFQLLNTSLLMKELIKKVTPGVQQKINKTDLKKICLDIPYIQEQNKIADFLSKLDEKIELEHQILQALQTQKKGFMQQMFI